MATRKKIAKEQDNWALPHRFNCYEYSGTVVVAKRYILETRTFVDVDTGRMCDFHIRLEDLYTHQELLSADCRHQVAHYHDERNGHKNSPRYDFAPATSHYEIENAYAKALDEIIPFARSKGIII